MKYLSLKKDILAFCFEDSADLLAVECIVSRFFEKKEEDKENTLKILLILLNENLIQAGWALKDGNFKPWYDNPNEIIKKIKRKWNKLNRELLLGDIVWFNITEKGKKEFECLNGLPELKDTESYFNDK